RRQGRNRAVEGHRAGAGRVAASGTGKRRVGMTAGHIPARVDAPVKEELLGLVDHAVSEGFSARWACRALGLDHTRMLSWRRRIETGAGLGDEPPGPPAGEALHDLLDWERDARSSRWPKPGSR